MTLRVPPALARWWRTAMRRQRAELLDEAQLAELGFETPHTHHQVHEAIAALIVRAPDYRLRSAPEYDIEVGYSIALQGLDRLHGITPSVERAAHIADPLPRLQDVLHILAHALATGTKIREVRELHRAEAQLQTMLDIVARVIAGHAIPMLPAK